MVLIFFPAIFWCRRYYSHFFWIISLSQIYLFSVRFCLSASFSSFSISSAHSLSCMCSIDSPLILSILPSLFHSTPTAPPSLSPRSSRSTQAPSCFSRSYSEGGVGLVWLGWGWRATLHILSAYQSWGPVHSILLWSISQPLSQPHHWQMAVRAPVHSTHQPPPLPWPEWMQNVQRPTTEL